MIRIIKVPDWVLIFTLLFISFSNFAFMPKAHGQTNNSEPVLILGDRQYPPYEFLEEGQPKGLVVDVLAAITKEAGLNATHRLMQWSKAQELVQVGKADGHALMSATPDRKLKYDFSHPTLDVEFTLFVNAGDEERITPEALSGIKVGLTKGGFPFQKLSQDHPSITLVIIKDDLDGIGKLLKGDIDALATNRLTGQYQIQKHGAQGIVPVAWTLASKEIAIALRKGNPALLDKINRAIDSLHQNGTIREIQDQWLAKYSLYDQSAWFSHPLALMVGIILLAGLVIIVIGQFRRSNRR